MDNNNFQEIVSKNENLQGIYFRLLINDDIQDIIQLGAKQYTYHNKALENFNLTFEDNINAMNASDYEKIIEQGMSIGAFQDNKLIAFALGQDIAISTDKDIEISDNVKRLFSVYENLLEKDTVYEKGYCFFLIYLATDHEYEGKGLGSGCFNMSCKAAIQKQFKKYFVNAFHPGTKRITEKYFKETQIVCEIKLENKECICSMTAMF